MALWQHRTGTVGELARRLELPAHAMTSLLQRLERAGGLIVRPRSPIDSRGVLVKLTVGVELERSADTVQRTVEGATGLSFDALAALRGELHDVVDGMRATAAGSYPMEGKAP